MIEMGTPKDVVNHYTEIMNAPENPSPAANISDAPTREFAHIGYQPKPPETNLTPLARFLSEKHVEDRCSQRNSFNSREHRYGSKKAEIVDYCLHCNNEFDPAIVASHDLLAVYIKVLFHEAVAFPIYGLTIKRLDGVEVYGSNSWFEEVSVHSPPAGALAIFKISVKMNLVHGDYFFSLGIVERQENFEIIALDRRYDLIHLKIHQSGRNFGIVDLQADFFEHGFIT